MSERKGPITIITSLSEERNRWKTLAFAWKAAAIQAIEPCEECGTPAQWRDPRTGTYWCETHCGADRGRLEKVPWQEDLKRAMALEADV